MQKINKFNQFLLEKYPTIWNTKIVWMLLAGFIIHILFFIIGFISHITPVSLQKSQVTDDYYRDGIILVHIIISILMIVGWLVMMFKNNAFKNFYPQSKGKLFSQFFQYFVIILVCTSFYFSYMIGFKMFINNKYPDGEMKENIEIINRGNAFLSQDSESYTLENRLSPQPFYDLYCETDIKKIDRNKKYFVFYNRVYQYNSVYSKTSSKKNKKKQFIIPEPENSQNKEVIYSNTNGDKFETFYFKKDVIDVSEYVKSTGFSYYNFSELFYEYDSGSSINYYDKNQIDHENLSLKKKKADVNRKTTELLDKNNEAEIEKLLSQYLKISNKFGIENNLDAKQWAKMVYAPKSFDVHYFIKKYKPLSGEEYDPNNSENYGEVAMVDSVVSGAAMDAAASVNESGVIVDDSIQIRELNPEISKQISPEDYFKKNLTEYYFYTDDLKEFLTSVDDVKSYDFFSENIHIYLWLAFFLSTFILSFRITGLKSLLFSIISAGLLTLAVTLVTVLVSVSVLGRVEFFVAYLALILSLIILAIPILWMKKFSKLVISIFMNISLNAFVLFIVLIFAIITLHEKEACRYIDQYCETTIDLLGLSLSYITLVFGFIFTYFYTGILMKWKARPE
ncbi:MAG: hypothetical protein EOO19_07245 [Chryseobacterium sp.]|nr:MAG: hypothetical protein EOO19_07245 [Chryseobacterium sp.]